MSATSMSNSPPTSSRRRRQRQRRLSLPNRVSSESTFRTASHCLMYSGKRALIRPGRCLLSSRQASSQTQYRLLRLLELARSYHFVRDAKRMVISQLSQWPAARAATHARPKPSGQTPASEQPHSIVAVQGSACRGLRQLRRGMPKTIYLL